MLRKRQLDEQTLPPKVSKSWVLLRFRLIDCRSRQSNTTIALYFMKHLWWSKAPKISFSAVLYTIQLSGVVHKWSVWRDKEECEKCWIESCATSHSIHFTLWEVCDPNQSTCLARRITKTWQKYHVWHRHPNYINFEAQKKHLLIIGFKQTQCVSQVSRWFWFKCVNY